MTRAPRGGGRRIYRSVPATIGMIVSSAVAALLLVDLFLQGGLQQGLLVAPWVLLALWAVYALAYAPHVETDAEEIRFYNVLTVVRIPWGRVASLRLRWQVEALLLDGRVLRAFGGPSRGRPRLRARPAPAPTPTSSAPTPSTGSAADLASLPVNIRDISLMQRALDRARERGTDAAPVRRIPDLPALITLLVLVAWTVWSVLTVTAR